MLTRRWVVDALSRAKQDEKAGDFGAARRRLQSVIGSNGYNAEVCEAIARLSVQMGDPCEAGRWYFLCDSEDSDAQEFIDRFLAQCGNNAEQVASQLPRLKRATKRLEKLAAFPAAVKHRIDAIGISAAPQRPRSRRGSKASGRLVGLGCLLLLMAGVVCAAIGVATIAGWVGQLL